MSSEDLKRAAAAKALEFIEDGMVLGLGTGSTAAHFVRLLGERVKNGLKISGAPTSLATEALARECGVPLIDLMQCDHIDLTIDGADEFDPELNLIKGGGAALLREKIIADFSRRMIVITDSSKKVEVLGKFPLPVEVTQFGLGLTQKKVAAALRAANCASDQIALRRKDGEPVLTDGGHYILDCACQAIPDSEGLAAALSVIPGVMEHGLFVGMAGAVIVADPGGVQIYQND